MKRSTASKYVIAVAAIVVLPASASPLGDAVEADYPRLDGLFRYFHANPELSMQEHKTSDRLAAELEALGYDVQRGINETGLVGTIENGDGPVLMIRADMDGLPVKEDSGLDYASTVTQVNKDWS